MAVPLVTFALLTAACSIVDPDTEETGGPTDPASSSDGAVSTDGQPGSEEGDAAPVGSTSSADRFIANVTKADGSLVPWPDVNGEAGDGRGQAAGPADPTGWYEVGALGYVTTFARPVVTICGYDVIDVELTPSAPPVVIESDEQQIIPAEGVSVAVPAGALPAGTWLTVTEVPARHLSAPWAPVDGGHLSRVFSFEARGEDGAEVQPAAPLTLRLDDVTALGGVTSIATFDLAAGRWVQSGACLPAGSGVECEVPHFSLNTPVGGQPSDPPGNSEGTSGSPEADAQARAEELKQTIDSLEEQAGEELSARLQALLDSAVAAARSAPSRATKDRLASMIALGGEYGITASDAIDVLSDAYERVASEVIDGARQAKKPRCDYIPDLVGVVAEGEMISSVGARASAISDAVDLLTDIELECRYLWTGTIEYRFPAPDQWEIFSSVPPGARYEDRGIDEWVETASVMITVDPESGQLEGTVTDVASFVPLRFRLDLTTPDQPCQGEYWEDFTVEGIGRGEPRIGPGDVADLIRRAASGAAPTRLEFDGFHEPPRFSVSPPRLVGDTGLRIQTRLDIYSFIVPCENISDSIVDEEFVIDPYTTQLIDGFGFLSPVEPRVSLDEMLNSPSSTEPDGRIVIEGRRELTVGMDLAVPFRQGTVRWRFTTESLFEGYGEGG